MLELVKAGGWPMIPLLLLSAAALAIIVERFWSLRRITVLPPGLGDEVRWPRADRRRESRPLAFRQLATEHGFALLERERRLDHQVFEVIEDIREMCRFSGLARIRRATS